MLIQIQFLLFVYNFLTKSASAYNNVIDVDDILSADFMPTTLLVLENPQEAKNFNETILKSEKIISSQKLDGSINNAMQTMGFHRSKMNEYLCRSYIAEQIINEMTLSRIKRRMGVNPPISNHQESSKISFKNDLLKDEGSTNYKDWLSKSTTLEDIYRHYNNIENKSSDEDLDEDKDKDDEINEDFDGHITGFAIQQPNTGSPSKLGYGENTGIYYSGGGSGAGGYQSYSGHGYPYGSSYGSTGGFSNTGFSAHGGAAGHTAFGTGGTHVIAEHEHVIHEPPPKYHVYHEESHSSKDHNLSDLFEIALTALAYLSFGMFIIHVIMCLSMAHETSTTTAASMMMPMSMSPTATGMSGGGTGGDADNAGTNGGGTEADSGSDNMGITGTGGGSTAGDGDGETGAGSDNNGGDEGESMMGDNESPGDESTGDGSAGTGSATGTGTGTSTETGTGGTSTGADTGETSTGTDTTGRDTIKFRFRRNIPTITNPNNRALNELARRVLISIEASFVANNDDGNCLRRSLCENNKFSRGLDGTEKIWLPVWSLGMSWLSGRIMKNVAPATAMLDSLKASVLGLGKANCEIVYQNCDLTREKSRRRRKKKK